MSTEYLQRIVNLERRDYDAIKKVAREKGLGGKSFSAALRLIIREWETLTNTITLKPGSGSCPNCYFFLPFMLTILPLTPDPDLQT